MPIKKGGEVLARLDLPPFEPLFPFIDGFSQTLAAHFWPQPGPRPTGVPHAVPIGEAGEVVLIEYPDPATVRAPAPARAALLVHGLTGNHESTYVQRVSEALVRGGFRAFCMNMRNSGAGLGKARTPYHAGCSDDVEASARFVHERTGGAPLAVIGFSLGANAVLKTLGEGRLGDLPVTGVAISPPADLHACSRRLRQGAGRPFDFFFSLTTYRELAKMAPYLREPGDFAPWRPWWTLKEIDRRLTAPLGGFASVEDYYDRASARRCFDRIAQRTLVLTAEDDPVISPDFLLAHHNPHVDIVVTPRGGHVAFLDRRAGLRRWMDELILRYLGRYLG